MPGNCTTKTTIPLDLIIEILSLLPTKSLLRFQSVSKLWFTTIRSKTFVDSFLTRSKTRPRLLFTFYHRDSQRRFIFSAPEHDNNYNDDKFSSVMARYDMTISDLDYYFTCGSANGFICFRSVVSSILYSDSFPVCSTITVYNPTTRQIVKLPGVTSPNGRYINARLGYDPVEDQYKVLCVMERFSSESQDTPQEHFVCTVSSSQKQEWRKIENPTGDTYEHAFFGQVCIDGVLYYGVGQTRLVRFDVRTEKIEFIKTPKGSNISSSYRSNLIDYNGKVGGLERCPTKDYLVKLWVLEDVEKHEWSSMTYDLPHQWEAIFGVGVVTKAVIHKDDPNVFSPPFFVCYYDFNEKNIRMVRIRGIEDGDIDEVGELTGHTSCNPGHIENIRFL